MQGDIVGYQIKNRLGPDERIIWLVSDCEGDFADAEFVSTKVEALARVVEHKIEEILELGENQNLSSDSVEVQKRVEKVLGKLNIALSVLKL